MTEVIARISRMERLFDEASDALRHAPAQLHTPAMQEKLDALSAYLTDGDWLHDYTLDTQHCLPPTLKRGVLAQDSLYDLLCSAAAQSEQDAPSARTSRL